MKTRNYFPQFKDEGEVIAWFGEAKLVKFLMASWSCATAPRMIASPPGNGISLFMHVSGRKGCWV